MGFGLLQSRWAIKLPVGPRLDRQSPVVGGLFENLAFNEGGGVSVFNHVSRFNDAAFVNTPTWAPTRDGLGLKCNGSAASIPDHGNVAAGDVTVRIRFRLDALWSGTYTALFEKWINIPVDGDVREIAAFINTSGDLQFLSIGNSSLDSVGIIAGMTTVGAIYDFVIRRSGTTASVFVNGVFKGNASSAFTSTTHVANPTYVGKSHSANSDPSITVTYFQTWTRALTASEIMRLYVEPTSIFRQRNSRGLKPATASVIGGDRFSIGRGVLRGVCRGMR